MSAFNLPLVSWTNGTIMIGVFALVCVGLVTALLLLVNSGKKTK
jgi:Mg2+ and Co2+ transporter CorA